MSDCLNFRFTNIASFCSDYTDKLAFKIMNVLQKEWLSPTLLKEKQRLSITTW